MGDCLGTILRHSIVIVLVELLDVRGWPIQVTIDLDPRNVDIKLHAACVAIPLQTKCRADHDARHEIRRKSRVHLAECGEVDLHVSFPCSADRCRAARVMRTYRRHHSR